MQVLSTTLALVVCDPQASSDFLTGHFGYVQDLAFDGGAALSHPTSSIALFLLRQGIETLAPSQRNTLAQGVILALTVANLEGEMARLAAEGVDARGPIQEDSWGERSLQFIDPNGLVVQLVAWAGERPY